MASFDLQVSEQLFLNMLLVATAGFVGALRCCFDGPPANAAVRPARNMPISTANTACAGCCCRLIGMLFGVVLALVWIAIFAVANIDPTVTTWAAWALLFLAWLAGLGQPWLYGAR